MGVAERIEILWEVCPGLVVLGGVISVLTACFIMLAAYTIVYPEEEAAYDA